MSIPKMWQSWVTPQATTRQEAFRERVLRVTVPIILITSAINVVVGLISPDLPDNRGLTWLVYAALAAVAALLITRQHLTSAAMVIATTLLLILGVSQLRQGYWTGFVYTEMGIGLVIVAMVASRRLTVAFAAIMVLEYSALAIWQDYANQPYTNPLPPSDALGTPQVAILVVVVYVGTVLGLGMYLLQEMTERADIVRQMVATLEDRVAERTHELAGAKEEAEAARDEALQANRVKSQFLASMSHELRTPLNAILNFSQFIMTGMVGDVNDEQVDLLSKINSSGKHLLALINDVLDISKIESGALNLLVEQDVDLNEELQPVIDTAQSMLEDRTGVELRTDIAGDLPLIIGDKRRIRQIMLNLVSNACKFTSVGHVSLRIQQQDGALLFAVEDTGPGIPSQDRDLVFETFRQSETGLRQGSGTGLGLPISKRLAEIHGGKLWFESTPGEGSTFYVSLPIHAAHLLHDNGTS